jgi:hypothetical protein
LKGEFGELELETPRDRKATFDPKIVAKGQTHWTGFDDKTVLFCTQLKRFSASLPGPVMQFKRDEFRCSGLPDSSSAAPISLDPLE